MRGANILMPEPGPAYRLLDKFSGRWITSGNMKPVDGGPELKIEGTDTYNWLPGGFFMQHLVDVMIGDEPKQVTEIIGFDPSQNTYFMHFYDHQGDSGSMTASEHHGIWIFASESMRFTGAFNDDESVISGIWEYVERGEWAFLMDIKLTKDLSSY
jgi:hypothetical protein